LIALTQRAHELRIRASDADATVIWATGPGLAIARKNHRQLGLRTPLYVSHAGNDFNYLRLAGEAANEVLLSPSKIYVAGSLPAGDPQRPPIERFVSAYEKEYGKKLATVAGNGFDAVMILTAAIRKAGSDQRKSLQTARSATLVPSRAFKI